MYKILLCHVCVCVCVFYQLIVVVVVVVVVFHQLRLAEHPLPSQQTSKILTLLFDNHNVTLDVTSDATSDEKKRGVLFT